MISTRTGSSYTGNSSTPYVPPAAPSVAAPSTPAAAPPAPASVAPAPAPVAESASESGGSGGNANTSNSSGTITRPNYPGGASYPAASAQRNITSSLSNNSPSSSSRFESSIGTIGNHNPCLGGCHGFDQSNHTPLTLSQNRLLATFSLTVVSIPFTRGVGVVNSARAIETSVRAQQAALALARAAEARAAATAVRVGTAARNTRDIAVVASIPIASNPIAVENAIDVGSVFIEGTLPPTTNAGFAVATIKGFLEGLVE